MHTNTLTYTLKKVVTLGLFCTFFSTGAMAQWNLNSGASSFYYVTSKASAVSEVNTFSGLQGSISESGEAELSIALDTVDTAIDVRNQRMRDIVFQINDYPTANVSLQVDAEALESMSMGMTVTGSYTAIIELHGMQSEIMTDLQVTRLTANSLQVQTARPIIVNAGTFGLTEGVEELRNLAGLPSINPNVVVDFTLLFTRN